MTMNGKQENSADEINQETSAQNPDESTGNQNNDQEQTSESIQDTDISDTIDDKTKEEVLEEATALIKDKKRKWVPFIFEEPFPPMTQFDLHPVTDVVVRNAVDDGVKNKRDLTLYKTTEEWNNYPPGTVIIASEVEVGMPFAVWDPPRRRKKKAESDSKEENSSEI